MSARGNQPAKRRAIEDQGNTGSSKPKAPSTEWQIADDQLDEALRDTFPASDAVSVVQAARRT